MKKKAVLFAVASLLIIAGVIILFSWKTTMETKISYRLNEPMLISSSKGEPYYMLPTNTVLHFQHGFPEGHQLYTIEVFVKGTLPAEQISPHTAAESTWLYQLDAEDVSKILHQYPLPKADLVRILKARKMTRDDLAEIVREWKDD